MSAPPEVYVAGAGLASALGPNLPDALRALGAGGVPPQPIELAPQVVRPFHRIDDAAADWWLRTLAIVARVATESDALAGARSGPLIVASSSVDIGAVDHRDPFHGDAQLFAERLAAALDWRGPVFTVSTACTSGINALLSARAWLRAGKADHALVLGTELFNRLSVAGFAAMQLLGTEAARPFGTGRRGLVLGEAVAALHLSTRPSRWRLAGGANVVDGRDPAGMVREAIVAMCHQALAASCLRAGDIDVIKLQAAGSPAGDAAEAAALKRVFEPLPALLSLKAAIGHTLGAAGAAEIALLLACIEAGVWPAPDYPQDPALGAQLAASAPQRLRYLLASILGFGGGHAAVVLEDGGRA